MISSSSDAGSPSYDAAFYRHIGSGSERSARRLLPPIFDLVAPRSCVDLGCGEGSWLSVCKELGAEEVLGLDGPWVDPEALKIPSSSFRPVDLSGQLPPLPRFDLAMSLEVAEHLPGSAASGFVDRLVALAPAVLFAAAVPGQGGTGHINEQWADYWIERFTAKGYRAVDAIRPAFWNDDDVDLEPWYVQNTFLFVSDEVISRSTRIAEAVEAGLGLPARIVHPRVLGVVAKQADLTLGRHLRRLPAAAGVTLGNRLAPVRRSLEQRRHRPLGG